METGQMNGNDDAPRSVAPVRPGRGGVAALLIAVAALALGAWTWMAQQRLAGLTGELAGDVRDVTGSLAGQAGAITDVRADLRRVAEEESGLAEGLAGLRAALDELARVQTNVDFALAEVEYLLTLAQHQLLLARDVDTASAAMEAAARRLEGLDAPGLDAVRAQVAVDLMRLRDVPRVDAGDWYGRLGALLADVPVMPLRAGKPVTAQESGTGPATGWRSVVHEVWQELRRLVVIKRYHEDRDPLPVDRGMLGQVLQVRIEAARLALQRGDGQLLRIATDGALEWLSHWYDMADARVRAARRTLEELRAVDPAPDLPDITSSLETLRALERERMVPDALPAVDPGEREGESEP